MKRQDYTTLISHYIPNVKSYHFIFPLDVLNQYKGPDNLDETLDDNLIYFIIEPLLRKKVEYNFELIWKDEDDVKSLDICVKVNDEKFDLTAVVNSLTKKQMISGLKLYKEEYGNLTRVY